MVITTSVYSDLQTPGFPPIVNAVQGEQYSRRIKLALYSAGVAWTVPAGAYVAMRYKKPDGTRGYYDTMPDGTQAWSAEENVVNIYVAPQMLTVAGVVLAQVEIIQNDAILATFPLRLRVAENLAAPLQTSEDYVNWLQWMEDQLALRWADAMESGELTGPKGEDAVLESAVTEFQLGSSGEKEPTGQWSQDVPAVQKGKYLWVRTTARFNSGPPVVIKSVAYSGTDGTPSTLEQSTTEYQVGPNGSAPPTDAWSAAIPEVPQGEYLWIKTTIHFNSGSPVVMTVPVRFGVDGLPAVLESSVVEYQASDSGTIEPSGAWSTSVPVVPQGKYLWTRTTTTYNTGSPVVSYSISRMGIDGTGSVSSVCGVSPGSDGDVTLTAENVGAMPTTGGDFTGPVNMNGQKLRGLNSPTADDEAATKGYVDTEIKDKVVKHEQTAALPASGWSNLSQSVAVEGVTADNTVIVTPAPESYIACLEAGAYCSGQGAGTLSFGCIKAPSGDIAFNILILD